jgi:cyclophilin family peptidyl-prolyl cis-trans isomerase
MRIVRSGLFVVIFCAALSARAQSIPSLARPFPAVPLSPGGEAMTIDVRNFITVAGVTSSQFAQVDTVVGKFNIELLNSDAPLTVANFQNYISSGRYQNTYVHRAVTDFVIQAGGYMAVLPPTNHIPTFAPVQNEFKVPNTRGTVAMAKVDGDPNSATSEWFVNLGDNRANLDNQNGGFTVFGRVLGTGMSVVDAIAALPRYKIGFDDPSATAPASTPLRNVPANETQLRPEYYVTVTDVKSATLFPTGGGASVLELSVQNSASGVVETLLSGSTLTLTPKAPGTADITVRAVDTNGNATQGTFTVTVASTAPVISRQPTAQTMAAGSTLVLSAPATGAPSYVWKRDGVDVPGAVTDTLVIRSINPDQAGSYVAYASNSFGTATSAAAQVSVIATSDPGRLINLSILTPLAAGDTMTMGTVLGGSSTSGAKPLLARAAGPSLARLGVNGFLPDPTMTLVNTGTAPNTTVAINNDWSGAAELSAAFNRTGAFTYTDAASKDAAIFQPGLAPGNYTVQVKDTGAGTGMVIAELYDASGVAYSPSTPRLINVSVLKPIANNTLLTAGFVVGGSTSKTVLIRAVGPTLGPVFGIGDAMADPQLKLFDAQQNTVASNDDWGGTLEITSAAEAVGAFRLAAGTSKDAVLLLTLPPGSYTAQISGANNTGGTAIVEVYEVP